MVHSFARLGDAAAVGSYPSGASPCGGLDMAGRVEEWVADWCDVAYYVSSPPRNPSGLASGRQHGVKVWLITYHSLDSL
jgi:formylglycine-generating enzyme required for sulfatase activity